MISQLFGVLLVRVSDRAACTDISKLRRISRVVSLTCRCVSACPPQCPYGPSWNIAHVLRKVFIYIHSFSFRSHATLFLTLHCLLPPLVQSCPSCPSLASNLFRSCLVFSSRIANSCPILSMLAALLKELYPSFFVQSLPLECPTLSSLVHVMSCPCLQS